VIFGEGFPTADGRARLVPVSPVPPSEQPDEEFPFVLVTGRTLEHWHTGAMTRRAPVLDALEPEPFCAMARADMERLKLAPGDRLRLSTRRGAIELMAREDPAIAPGTVFVPFCYVEAAANLLTRPELDPFGKIPEFKYSAARIVPAGSTALT
jgi:formate dehydrogenase major subunit